MGNDIILNKGLTAYVTGVRPFSSVASGEITILITALYVVRQKSISDTKKEVIVQVFDNDQASETFYLYGQGENPFLPPKGDPPVKIQGQGQDERRVVVLVRNGDKLSTLVKSAILFESDQPTPPSLNDALAVIYVVKN
ncbi:hypothetical protein H0H92_012111 [Tricholoma furcatifolium]|nr:hypothetical protein H0H92_012111 [Tricholoma furcatifolium]